VLCRARLAAGLEYARSTIRSQTQSLTFGVTLCLVMRELSRLDLKTLAPMGIISSVQDIVDAVVYVTEAHM